MTQPLALLVYERLIPGGQLANQLQDLGYRVLPVPDPADLTTAAAREKPIVAFVDLEPHPDRTCAAIAALHQDAATSHVPVIAFASVRNAAAQEQARVAGAKLVVTDLTVIAHLAQFLDQALLID